MLPLLERTTKHVTTHVAALPVPYRTTEETPSFASLEDPDCDLIPGDRPFPTALDPSSATATSSRTSLARRTPSASTTSASAAAPAAPHPRRRGRPGPNASGQPFPPDMSKQAFFGTDARVPDEYKEYAAKL